jgi:hypothetical protein
MGSISWSDLAKVAGDGGFTIMPPGEHDVYVHTATGGKTSTGKDRIRVVFKVENGPHAGSVITNDFVITPDNANAMSIFFRNATVLGLDSAYFAANPNAPIEKVATDLQAKRARARLRTSTREWQGQTRTNVDAVLPPQPGTAGSAPAPSPSVSVQSPSVPSVPQMNPVLGTAVPPAPSLPDDLPF